MLFGFAFFSHQLGGFLGAWLGGVPFEHTQSRSNQLFPAANFLINQG